MANDTRYIHNVALNLVESIELTDEEQAQLNAERIAAIEAKEQRKTEQELRRQTKISAYEKLGLTEAEIEALLPTPAEPIS